MHDNALAPRRRRSLRGRLDAIIGFLGLIPMIGAAVALVMVSSATDDSVALDRTARGTIELERINGLIYAVELESLEISRAADWNTAAPFSHSLTDHLVALEDAAHSWKTEAIASQQSNVDELAHRIDEFVRMRTTRMQDEVGRLNGGDASPRSAAEVESDRAARIALNDSLTNISHAYQLEIGRARGTVERNSRYFIWTLTGLAGAAFIGLCIGLLLVRRGLLTPLLRVRNLMLRLAQGHLDAEPDTGRGAAEIAEMEQAIAVFRDGLVERSRLNREAKLLSELNDWLQSCNSLQELYDMVGEFLARLLPGCAGSLYVYANSRDVLEGTKAWNNGKLAPTMHPEDCWGLRRGSAYTFGQREIDFPCGHVGADNPGTYCCIPILAHGETIGLLHLGFSGHRHESNDEASAADVIEQRRLGLVCAEQISLAIANVKLRDQLRDQSIRDPLTGLFNRRYMLETCRREFSRAQRNRQSVSVLSIDVDHFKKFNDNHGHDAGDIVLREVGKCLEAVFRNEDVACRFGGEEFVVILPGAPIEIAVKRAEELREKIEALSVRYLESNLPRITISVGVAAFPAAGDTPEGVLKAADEALYRAKGGGRNRVELDSADPASAEAHTLEERRSRAPEKFSQTTIPVEAGKLAAD